MSRIALEGQAREAAGREDVLKSFGVISKSAIIKGHSANASTNAKVGPPSTDDRPTARDQEFGPDAGRPRGDDRSAEEIVQNTPTLSNLAPTDKDWLARSLGKKDWDDLMGDPDAAYRAASVINHIEHYDEDGNVIEGDSVGDGRIDGWTRADRTDKKSEAKNGTEAGRFQDFNKYGWSYFKHNSTPAGDGMPKGDQAANGLDRFTTRPSGDSRSAELIIEDTPELRDLSDDEKRDLKRLTGDFEKDPDAAYRAAAVVKMVSSYDDKGRPIYGDTVLDGKINGGERNRLKDFFKQGFSYFEHDIPLTGRDTSGEASNGLNRDTVRPPGDDRSAEEITEDTPTLQNLGETERAALRQMVGDYENDADAAYRAAAVINYIENFEADGTPIKDSSVGDGTMHGWTSSHDAQHGTEAGRFQDFVKYGFSRLQGDARPDGTFNNTAANGLNRDTTRPPDDDRSAAEIIAGTPLLANLSAEDKDRLKQWVGDFETDADAAYRAICVLEMVQNYDDDGRARYGDETENERIDGYHYDPSAAEVFLPWKWGDKSRKWNDGSEADRLEEFFDKGFEAFGADIPREGRPTGGQATNGLNHDTRRPEGDRRSAEEIIADTPTLNELDDREKHALKQYVGDFENDADAAFRAASVINQIERFDADGNEIFGDEVGDGKVSGWTSSREAKNGTEAGRLQDFIKYGFASLKGDARLDGTYKDNTSGGGLDADTFRPEGDNRSAREILADNPELQSLSDEEKAWLKKHVGDFERDSDAAYRAASVLNHIRNFDENGNFIPSSSNRRSGWFAEVAVWPKERHDRLEDFGTFGFRTLVGEDANMHGMKKDTPPPAHTMYHGVIGPNSTRPEGDDRDAATIIRDNPVLAQLSERDKQALMRRVGNFANDPDAAFRAVAVLNHIEHFDAAGNRQTVEEADVGRINGWTREDRNDPNSQAKPNTEAGRFQDFIDHGYGTLTGHSDIDGFPVGLDKRDVPRPGIAGFDGLPEMPLSLDERERIMAEGHAALDGALSTAPEGSKGRTLHNLIRMMANANTDSFDGKVDKQKLQEDIAELLNDPEIVAIQERIEGEVAKKVTGRTGDEIVREAEALLNDPNVQARLAELPPAERQRYVKTVIDTVAMFDQDEANELRGQEMRNTLDTALGPEQVESMTEAEITGYVDEVILRSIAIGRLTNGLTDTFVDVFNKIPEAGKGDATKSLVLLLKNIGTTGEMSPDEMVEFLASNGITESQLGPIKSFIQKLGETGLLTTLGGLLAGAHFITRFTNGGGSSTPWDRLTAASDFLSMTGQLAGGAPSLWKFLGVPDKARSFLSATKDFYAAIERHIGKTPDFVEEGRPPTPVDLQELSRTAEASGASIEMNDAIDAYLEELGDLAPDDGTRAIFENTREAIEGADSPEGIAELENMIDEFLESWTLTAGEADVDVPAALNIVKQEIEEGIDILPEAVMEEGVLLDVNDALDISGARDALDLPRLTTAEAVANPEAVQEQVAQVLREGEPELVGRFMGIIPRASTGTVLKVVSATAPVADLLYSVLFFKSGYDDFVAGRNERGVFDVMGGLGYGGSSVFFGAELVGAMFEISALSGPLFPILGGFSLVVGLLSIVGNVALANQEKNASEREFRDLYQGGAGNGEDYWTA